MEISANIHYVGVNDHGIDLFEGQFAVPNGMAYNSYLLIDEKTAVMDSVGAGFGDEWLANIRSALGEKSPDYLVVQHMEMDHSANIMRFAEAYPGAKIVSSKMAFTMMKSYFGTDFADRQIVVAEGSRLELGAADGARTLTFIAAPNVHWPEVIMTYDGAEKTLFSADAFGTFGANDRNDVEDWEREARRYYFGIVGAFGAQAQAALKKAAALDIERICALHGPVLDKGIAHYLSIYSTWAGYGVESGGVVIAYASVYGNTKAAAEKLADILRAKGCPAVSVRDLARADIHECVAEAFRYGSLVLAAPTYNGGVFPAMRDFIEQLTERNYQNRNIALIENGSWAPAAAKAMRTLFGKSAGISFAKTDVTIKIAVTSETVSRLESLADELLA